MKIILNKICSLFLFLTILSCSNPNADIELKKGQNMSAFISELEESAVKMAFEMLSNDFNSVFDASMIKADKSADIYIGTLGIVDWADDYVSADDIQNLKKHEEAFLVTVSKGKLVILGSDKRGTAYGILEISRMIGVSPWEWWADSKSSKKEYLTIKADHHDFQFPSVARRGIFINDEDWGLTPWSNENYDPSDVKGEVGPKTTARIFELLLRLRANTYWPPMHSCSVAFYETPGNKEIADKYSIFVGTSHCEPMLRNTNAEWRREIRGRYNYLTNRDKILEFWEERTKELAKSDNIYTLGLRGEHDEPMEGVETVEERKEVLIDVLKVQREMLAKYVNPDVSKVSQVFIPYKEVLDVYRLGLEVPEDVTLLWCDDNFGYIRHFPTKEEQARSGGNGMYYHVSYWGRPHDYLWLATMSPAQIYSQVKLAYDKGTRNTWVLNVGDIKPAEYLIEFYMDVAWNIDCIDGTKDGLDAHLKNWLAREFGEDKASELTDVMNEYYRLAYIRKPEHMGHTRTEEWSLPYWKIVSDFPWSKNYIEQRISQYKTISDKVVNMSKSISPEKQSAWFQLVEYPVRASTEMNFKHLYGQLARHEIVDWSLCDNAYDNIAKLTKKYNNLENGKWKGMMDMHPRDLPVFQIVEHTKATKPLVEDCKETKTLNGTDYIANKGEKPLHNGLGYEREAIYLDKGSSVDYEVSGFSCDTLNVQLALAPNHPVEGGKIRYAISLDGGEFKAIDYATQGRSEEWKQNVIRNQALRTTKHLLNKNKKHTITIKALDEGVIIDQIKIIIDTIS